MLPPPPPFPSGIKQMPFVRLLRQFSSIYDSIQLTKMFCSGLVAGIGLAIEVYDEGLCVGIATGINIDLTVYYLCLKSRVLQCALTSL